MTLRLVIGVVVVAVGLVAAPAARGATVGQIVVDSCRDDVACSKYGGGTPVPVTVFRAEAGEANRVTVAREGATFVFADAGAPVRAQAPCRQIDERNASCPVTEAQPGIEGLSLSLGDGDDQATVVGDPVVETNMFGGEGTDALTGGGENDTMFGGPGDDRMIGGGGFDVLSYADRSGAVTVDMAAGSGGELGERDGFSGFETLLGGAGDDRLRGGRGAQTIDGGGGDDVIAGAAGADALFGNVGADRLVGSGGDDRLFGDPAQGDGYYTPIIRLRADTLLGGAGDDELYDTGGRNLMVGGPGRDRLEGGAAPDRLQGGAGPDRIEARRGGADRVHCGSGVDRARTDARDTRRRCERGR